MTGERELSRLLAAMKPELRDGEFVFCAVTPEALEELCIEPVGWFREREGITLIVERNAADSAGLKYGCVMRMITLTVHSVLEAVGFLAAITKRLAEAGISVNPVSAFYHDHLFVPSEKAPAALKMLDELMSGAGQPEDKPVT
ncbi:ACT domain-containing protein [bacterium]|nr:ACT domain-containing protein [bacterium]